MARRDPVGIRLLTRNGNDWSARFPLVVEAVNHLKVRSCLIDGDVVCCDEWGLAIFSTRIHALEILGRLDGDDLAVAGGGRRYSPNAVQAMVPRK
jgi:hypothetical protein